MPDENHQCPPGKYCVNISELRGELRQAVEKVGGELKLYGSKVDDMATEVRDMPSRFRDVLQEWEGEVDGKLDRGTTKFDQIFARLGKTEKWLIILSVILGVHCVEDVAKAVAWLVAIIRGTAG